MTKKPVFLVIIAFIIVGGIYLWTKNSESQPPTEPLPAPVNQTSWKIMDSPDGGKSYIDNELGFQFEFPVDWVVSPREKVINPSAYQQLEKGSDKILIDPFGIIGADEFHDCDTCKIEELSIKGFVWKKLSSSTYYRYQAQESIGSKNIPNTQNFKLHLYVGEDSSQAATTEAISVFDQIVNSLQVVN